MIAELAASLSRQPAVGELAVLLLRGACVLVPGLLLWYMLRRAPARVRHLILGAAIGAVLLVPIIGAFLPELPLPLLATGQAAVEPLAVTAGEPAYGSANAGAQPAAAAAEVGSHSESGPPAAVLVYGAGVLLAVGYLALGLARLLALTRRAHEAAGAPDWKRAIGSVDARAARILVSDAIGAPVTWGFFRPVVLLPEAAASWSDVQRRNALLHELAHVERGDWAVQMLCRLTCTLHWFNPLVWMTLKRLTLEAELAADERVLACGAAPHDYASQLVALTRASRPARLPLAATTMSAKHMLHRRVASILTPGDSRMNINRAGRCAVIGLIALFAAFGGTVTLVAAPQDDAPIIDESVSTPLIRAAARGDAREVERLLTAGADVNETSDNRGDDTRLPRSALVAAAEFGHLDVVRMLLDAGAPVDRVVPGDPTALIAATRRDHFDITRLLIDRGADANLAVRGDGSPLIGATIADNADAVRLLLERGAEPDLSVRGDENPLYHAVRNGNEQILQMLIDAGADLDQEWPGDGTALIVATREGNDGAAQSLIRAGARPDHGVPRDGNAMIVAAEQGNTSLLQQMIATGADVNAAVEGDGSPLIQAARNGHMDAVVMLLQAGADIDMVVPGDENALIGAAREGDTEMVDYLLRSGADPNIKARSYGETRTALNQARLEGHDDVVRLLEAAGATE